MNLIFGSVTSGIEAASVAWGPLGWKAAFVAEIEPFPCHLLHHHYGAGRPHHMPDPTDAGLTLEERDARLLAIKNVSALPIKHKGLRNLGDLNKYKEWSDDFYLDVLCGGTPCQSYSNAGLRAGLDDPRGQLMLAFGGVAAKYRPRWLVWENVPGVLSSNGGRDFAELLGLLTGQQVSVPAGGWKNSGVLAGIAAAYGVAWRVLDAQYAGLAQRRERVFLVGYLGDWRPAAAVFFERHSMQGHRAPSRRPAQAPSGRTDGGVAVRGAPGGPEVSATIDANYGRLQGTSGQDAGHGHATLAIVKKEEAGPAAFGGNNTTGPIDVATAVRAHSSFHGDFESETFIAFDTTQITNKDNRSNPQPGDPCHTLPAHGHPPAIAFQTPVQRGAMAVRRFTPLECEKLQGFPVGYTLVPYRTRRAQDFDEWCAYLKQSQPDLAEKDAMLLAADGPRYKSIGNSWAVPVVTWIGTRIEAVEAVLKFNRAVGGLTSLEM